MLYIWLSVRSQQEQTMKEEEMVLIGYMAIVLIILSSMVVLFFMAFQKRKNKLLLDQIEQQKIFDEELSRTQTEIQEQTLKHIGRELHDNVGQLLAYANMQLNMLGTKAPDDIKGRVSETAQIVQDSLTEVRALSKSLNNDVLLNMGFKESILNELERSKRLQFKSADLKIVGDFRELNDKKHEIIIFRILQEFFSNSVKYSEADMIEVVLDYRPDELVIMAKDDGKGFDVTTAEKGSGLINMRSRAELIGASFNMTSEPDNGVVLEIHYPFTH